MRKSVLVAVVPVCPPSDAEVLSAYNCLVYPTGVVETVQGYDPAKSATAIWRTASLQNGAHLVFFPNERGEGLVAFHRDGKPTYREGYTPDPVAREFWEAIAKADPGYHPTEEPFTVPDYVEIREEGGSKPNPGFTGVWGTGGSIDCFRPR